MRAEAIAVALMLLALGARAQAPSQALGRSPAAAQLEALAQLEPGGSSERMATEAGRGPDGTRVTIPEAVETPAGVRAPYVHDADRMPGLHPTRPRPPMLKDPFPRSEDGRWVGAGEYFLTVEKFPLSMIRQKGASRVVGAALAVLFLIPAIIGAAVGAVVGSTW